MASASVQEKYGWELKAADLAFVKDEESCLGRGGYGEVYRGKWRGTTVAIKSLILQRLTARARKEFIQVRLVREGSEKEDAYSSREGSSEGKGGPLASEST
jgi:hypothetical protein